MLDVTKPVDHRCHFGLRKHRYVTLQRVVIAFGQEEVSEGSRPGLMTLQIVPRPGDFLQSGLREQVGVDGFSQGISHHADLFEAGSDSASCRRLRQASRIAEQHGTFPDWPPNHAAGDGATIPRDDLAVREPLGVARGVHETVQERFR